MGDLPFVRNAHATRMERFYQTQPPWPGPKKGHADAAAAAALPHNAPRVQRS